MTPEEIREQRERYRDRAVALRVAALEVHHQGALDIANGIRSEMAIALSPLGGRCRPLSEVDELLTRYESIVDELAWEEDDEPEHDDHTDRRLCQGIGCPYGDH